MSDQPMPDSQSGMSLDKRYQLIDKIGEGGMGVVFQARDRLTGQIVALKKVTVSGDQLQFASKSTDQDFRLSLAQEFRTMASLRHPNIVGVLDYGFDEQRQPYYTMQIIEGAKTITEYAIGQTTAHKIRLLIETLQALGYLHRRDIVHRDIKPANIMVTAGGTVQVMDFGLALHQTESFTNLHTGVVGTMAYIAPELFAEERATIRSDLYAVGLLAYEMFVGKYPFNSKNIAMMVNGILFEKPDTSSLDFELAKVLDRLIAKTPDQRYNSADETVIALCQATGQRTPGENTIQRESYLQAAKFVGRSQEIRQLKTALEQAVHGEGGAWLVGGESGAGKSRLLDELRTQALVAGALVLRGQAVAEGGLPYQIWREALRRLILATRLSDFEAGVLEVIVPDISSLLDREIAPVSRLDGQSEHKRLSMTIFEVFKRQTQPLVLILEDLHWLGDSIDLLQQLAQAAGEHPWLMIGSYRNDESPGLPNRLSGFKVLHLDRLNESAIADLSAAMLGDPGRKPEVIDLIKRETEGNAFFIVEVMRALAEDAGSLNEIGKSALPDTVYSRGVEEVVRRRLNRLPETVREWLKLAAVIGRQIDLNILNLTSRLFTEDLTTRLTGQKEFDAVALYVTDNIMPAVVDALLDLCANDMVLEFQDGNWRFAHDKIRETLLKDLTTEEQVTLNARIARAIESAYPNNPLYAEALANHWYRAGDHERTIINTVQAMEQVVNLVANYPYALQLIDRALALPAIETMPEQKAALCNWQGNIAERQGRYRDAQAYCTAGLTLIEKTLVAKDHPLVARLHNELSRALWRQGDFETAIHHASQAKDISQAAGNLKELAASIKNLAAIADYQGKYDTAQELDIQSLAICRQIGDRSGIESILNNMGVTAYITGQYTTARELHEESLTISREIRDRQGIALNLSMLARLARVRGEYPTARNYLEESLVISREIGDQRLIAVALSNLGSVMYVEELYDQAQTTFEQSLVISREIGDRRGSAITLNYLAAALLIQRKLPEARRILRESLELAYPVKAAAMIISAVVIMAQLYAYEGQWEKSALIAGLMSEHPLLAADFRVQHFNPLLKDLKLSPSHSEDELATVMERGKSLDLDGVIRQFLEEQSPA